MPLFDKFPKTFYKLTDSLSVDVVTNILARFSFEEKFKENTSVYYNYVVKDGETPEIIASKAYDDPEKHWIILMLNNIVDAQYDWPLHYSALAKYIEKKYIENANTLISETGVEWSQGNIHSYYMVETVTMPDGKLVENKFQIDSNTYQNLITTSDEYTLNDGNNITIAITKETKSYYEYEIDSNESKRTIKVLKKEFVSALEKELTNIFK